MKFINHYKKKIKKRFILYWNFFQINIIGNFRISIDYSRAEKNAILQLFPDIEILPCFFHFMKNVVKHLKEIRSKNKTIKKLAKDFLSNIKLLCFIPLNKFDGLYEWKKTKYRTIFLIFLNI